MRIFIDTTVYVNGRRITGATTTLTELEINDQLRAHPVWIVAFKALADSAAQDIADQFKKGWRPVE